MLRARANTADLKKLVGRLRKTAEEMDKTCKYALYFGGASAADALRKKVNALNSVPDVVAINAWRRGEPSLISVKQKLGLLEGLGIAKMRQKNKVWSVRVGFDGYNSVVTRRWPNGEPNVIIAAGCEHGNSNRMIEQPFIRKTIEDHGDAIDTAVANALNERLENMLEV